MEQPPSNSTETEEEILFALTPSMSPATALRYTAGQIMDSGSPVVLSNCNLPLNQSQGKLMEHKNQVSGTTTSPAVS